MVGYKFDIDQFMFLEDEQTLILFTILKELTNEPEVQTSANILGIL